MSAPILELRGLTRHFGGVCAVDAVDLTICRGEIHALIGPNGAGKTTLVNLVAGNLLPDAGAIVYDGADITTLSAHARAQRGLTRSFQIVSIFPRLSVLDNAVLAIQGAHAARLHWRAHEAATQERAAQLLARAGLGDRARVSAGILSHGEQRRLELALALASQPSLVLLDEPMAGIGPGETDSIAALIAAAARNAALLLVEHDMDTVFRLAHRISVLHEGRVIASGLPDAVRRDAEVRRAYLGEREFA